MFLNNHKGVNPFADEVWKFYRVTRLVGEVIIDRNNKDPTKPFEINLLSKTLFLTVAVHLYKLITCIYSLWIFSQTRDDSKSFYKTWLPGILTIAIGTVTIWRTVAVWIVAKQIKNFHNNWPQIYHVCPGAPVEFYYHSKMVFGCGSFTAPCLLFVISQLIMSLGRAYIPDRFHIVGSELKRVTTDLRRNFNASQAHKIKRGLFFARNQCEIACKFLNYSEGTDLVGMCIDYIISVATVMATYAGESKSGTSVSGSVFSLINVMVSYSLSQLFVNFIYSEERKILQTLISIDTSSPSMDIDTKFELKDMMDVLRSTPTQITFFGMITMNNGLFLTMTNAIVSYFMILLQLQPLTKSHGSDDTT